jgi:hypothetical protein
LYIDALGSKHTSLHANFFPLAFDLVANNRLNSVIGFIKSRGMACSVYGAQYLLEALYRAGEGDYAYDLLTATHERGWYNMIRSGSGMTTEAWDLSFKRNMDWNHAWGAAPANIIPRCLFGIQPLQPGFRRFQVKPQPGKLKRAAICMPTIRGPIEVTIEVKDNRLFQLRLYVPMNSEAKVYLPRFANPQNHIRVNGERQKADFRDNNWLLIELESGRHVLQRPM